MSIPLNDEEIYPNQAKEPQNSALTRLKKYGGRVAVTTLLSTTLLLGACGTDINDCVQQSNPPAPVPGSTGFTAAKPTTNSGTYCRSRSTGGFYYYGGYYGSTGGYNGSGGNSGSGGSS